MDSELLLHMCAPAAWRMALGAGAVAPPSLLSESFVHLSTPAQVQVPANALYAGRTDLVALVVDPARLPGPLRFEPAVDGSSPGVLFPHHYGPLPTAAVTAVVPYQPGPDGRFTEPVGLPAPGDIAARVRGFDRALAQRRAAVVVPVRGGIAVLDPRLPASYEHNTLWIDGPADAATVAADAAQIFDGAGLDVRRVVLDDAATAGALAARRWQVRESRLMAWQGTTAPVESADVVAVAHHTAGRLWERAWRRERPGVDAESLRQLVDREDLAAALLVVRDLAVLGEHGEPVATAQLRVDGATAAIEAVLTDPARQRRGLATALVLHALAQAGAAGCDAVFLSATAGHWTHDWYARLGFADVHTRYEATQHRDSVPQPATRSWDVHDTVASAEVGTISKPRAEGHG